MIAKSGPADSNGPFAGLDDQIDVFFGDANPAEARVYVRVRPGDALAAADLAALEIEAHVAGPECRFAKTLPARVAMIDRGPGETRLLEAVVPDPSFWTPDLPMLYNVTVTCRLGERSQTFQRMLGIRRFGAKGRSLYLDGERWAPRGAWMRVRTEVELKEALECGAVLCGPQTNSLICEEASRLGVPLFVFVARFNLVAELHRLVEWPAVFAVFLAWNATLDESVLRAPRNFLLGCYTPDTGPVTLPDWAQIVLCPLERLKRMPEHSRASETADTPFIVTRETPVHELPQAPSVIAAARRACDQLQFDAAEFGDFAGFIVLPASR